MHGIHPPESPDANCAVYPGTHAHWATEDAAAGEVWYVPHGNLPHAVRVGVGSTGLGDSRAPTHLPPFEQ